MSIASLRPAIRRQRGNITIPSTRDLRAAAERRYFKEPVWLITVQDRTGQVTHFTRPLAQRRPRVRWNQRLIGFAVIDISDACTKRRVTGWVNGHKLGLYNQDGKPKRDEFITINRAVVPYLAIAA